MVRCGGAMRPPCMVSGVMLVAVVVVVSPGLGGPAGPPPARTRPTMGHPNRARWAPGADGVRCRRRVLLRDISCPDLTDPGAMN